MNEEVITNLKEAIRFSPDNVPLRLHLADTLLQMSRYEEAENEYRYILEIAADHVKAKTGLAKAYYALEKYSTAIVILEELLPQSSDIELLVLYSRLLLREDSIKEAISWYKKVLAIDPSYKDEELDAHLRLENPQLSPEHDDSFADQVERNALPVEKPSVDFSNVGGMEKVKEEISMKIIKPMQHPELYKAYGKKVGGGILLYGPPGCGKTHLARATAGQVNAKFISVGINDILEMWVGGSEKKLHEVFELARANSPCVLFFDEVDALGASRSDMKQSAGRHLINQFLAELDGIESSNEGLLILAATNAPWHLDNAFRRPGRFDRIIFVQPPDDESRNEILKVLLKDKPVQNIDHHQIGRITREFSGADLQAVVDVAIEEKLKVSFTTGIPEPITTKDLTAAAKKVIPSTKEWFTTARNYALYSNESGLYDEILHYLKIKK